MEVDDSVIDREKGLVKEALDPNAVNKWLRTIEVPFLGALQEYGDYTDMGRRASSGEFKHIDAGVFTGVDLCEEATRAIRGGLMSKFGSNADVQRWVGLVEFTNNLEDKEKIQEAKPKTGIFSRWRKQSEQAPYIEAPASLHIWIRFKGNDGEWYFIDPTYGQINRNLNRIVMDKVGNEPNYYHYDQNYEKKIRLFSERRGVIANPLPLETYHNEKELSDEEYLFWVVQGGEDFHITDRKERAEVYQKLLNSVMENKQVDK